MEIKSNDNFKRIVGVIQVCCINLAGNCDIVNITLFDNTTNIHFGTNDRKFTMKYANKKKFLILQKITNNKNEVKENIKLNIEKEISSRFEDIVHLKKVISDIVENVPLSGCVDCKKVKENLLIIQKHKREINKQIEKGTTRSIEYIKKTTSITLKHGKQYELFPNVVVTYFKTIKNVIEKPEIIIEENDDFENVSIIDNHYLASTNYNLNKI